MSTSFERAKDKAQRLANPAQHRPKVGQVVTYRHPAGDVQGTVTTVTAKGLTLAVKRTGLWAGEPDAVLKFTLRPDGEYRLQGTGNSARPALVFQEG